MIDHTGVSVTDSAASKAFHDAAMRPLGASLLMTVPAQSTGGAKVVGCGRGRPVFWLREKPEKATPVHVASTAGARAEVDAFHGAALAAGGGDNGAPGLRPHYHTDYFGAFVLDPNDNYIDAVCHAPK